MLAPIKLLRQPNESLKIFPFLSNGNYGKNYRTDIAPLQSESSKLNTTCFSIVKGRNRDIYWSKDWNFSTVVNDYRAKEATDMCCFFAIMPCDKIKLILRFLSLAFNSTQVQKG